MRKLQLHWLSLLALAALFAWSEKALAEAPFPDIYDFNTPTDTYVPTSRPLDDPSLVFGSPPDKGYTYVTAGGGTFGTGFIDGRNGSYGLAVPVTYDWATGAGLSAVPVDPNNQYGGTVYHSGVADNSHHLAVWPQYGYGPTFRPGRQNSNYPDPPTGWSNQAQFMDAGYNGAFPGGGNVGYVGGAGNDNMGGLAKWSQQMDLYLDPDLPANGAIQYWWTNSITGSAGIPAYGYYATETGINPIRNVDGTYRIQSTGGGTIADGLSAGQWVTVEIRWDFGATKSAVYHNLYNIDPTTGLHTSLLGSYYIPPGSVFVDPDSQGLQGGSRTFWMPYWTTGALTTAFHATIDNEGLGIPIALSGRKGDLNNDTYVDGDDNSQLTQGLVDPTVGAANAGLSFAEFNYRGDINNDGYFDGDDIVYYVSLQTSDGIPGPSAGPVGVPEPSSFALLALGGLGMLLARQRKLKLKKGHMKGFTLTLMLLVVGLAVFSAGTAEASRMFLSLSSTSPTEPGGGDTGNSSTDAGTNPTLTITQGGSGSLYLWWDPSIDTVSAVNERLTSMGHDIVSSNPILSRTAYTVDNPSVSGTPRWAGTTSGAGAATYMVDNAVATAPSNSSLGFETGAGQGYDATTDTWRVATITFTNDSLGLGTSLIRIGVGTGKINFSTSPQNGRIVYMGFGDAGKAGNSSVNGSNTTTLEDATVIVVAVPEPATLALLGMGMVGLVVVARRRRSRA